MIENEEDLTNLLSSVILDIVKVLRRDNKDLPAEIFCSQVSAILGFVFYKTSFGIERIVDGGLKAREFFTRTSMVNLRMSSEDMLWPDKIAN